MTRHLFTLTLALHLAATASWAGPCISGTLCGQVTDSAGAVMPGADVRLTQVDTRVQRTVRTDTDGRWVARSLQPGEWEIVISVEGFRAYHYKSKVSFSRYRFEPKSRPIESRIVIVPLAKEDGQ